MAELTIRQIRKSYGTMEVLHGIDLDVQKGEFMVFVGPSGCGKSTLLRSIAGLEDITSGELRIEGQLMNHVPPSKRGIAMVFQSYALYPHMTVRDNMAFGMKIAGMKKSEIEQRVRHAADILQLGDYLDRHPKALSGGQRQRVAIGRAIVRDPRVFLFDEPLSNLDAALRVATRIEIAKLKQAMPDTTMIYVTHDQVEAMTLADRIIVLKDGYVEQIGAPKELYRSPRNIFVAQFIGSPAMNIVEGKVIHNDDNRVTVEHAANGRAEIAMRMSEDIIGRTVRIGVRPEDLSLADQDGPHIFVGTIDHIEHLGEVQLVHLDTGLSDRPVIAKLAGSLDLTRGQDICLRTNVTSLHLFDDQGERLNGPAAG
ncbi:ABC transporter ATP-binding protein [Paracoccus saliphilus]|uniref:Maltose ABC transporter ATP-binding protein /trehalose ABC transporter ATP-binding protein /sucrose ABC transporter ATP-binding protein n=1 Tax=Paracoccus saliphilus TaxID=405559 RepID=A0AA45W8I6_9RHOB|nr:sn-glycerol-3-phosphate ABC transporter ATP-binding protein UgpC [Paracoccus saliphilus]WCR02646.1 sn-glycerol-3-phosphate ABC transporter ATP-binding protein UgpC [Paracoccus saliphilus]SIT17207.1 maltose ABC transporter ATP-binding protein /trehalose ABC transporter ATP-binding protein /sucrose ABC transporter ATP-binding protein [Paracoccus saliphilus]